MPYIEVETTAAGPPEAAFALAKNMEDYPRFMKDVVYLKVLERDGATQVSEWHARLQGRIIRWKERDVFDEDEHTITYQQTEGDLKRFEGEWHFLPVPEGTRITLSVDFDLGVPMLAALMNSVATIVVRRNCEDMLAGLRKQLAR